MDYFGILKKSYEITLKHKFLWIFGILSGGSSLGIFRGFSVFFNLSNGDLENSINKQNLGFGGLSLVLILFIAILVLTVGLIFLILNITSQGALITGFSEIEKGNTANFKNSLDTGWSKFWRILGLNIIVGLSVIASLVILIAPITILIIAKAYAFAIIFGILFFLVCLFFWIILSFVYPYSLQMVVLESSGIFKTIRAALHLVRDNFLQVIVVYLLVYMISLGYGLVLLFLIALIGIILFAIGYGIFLASSLAAIIYGCIFGLIFLAALIIISGAYNTFNFGVITLTYLKLKK